MAESQSIISVDLNELGFLVENGNKILFTPTAENALLRLLELQELVEMAMKSAKEMIEEAALKYNPNFTSVTSDKIKVMYRFYGAKYETEVDFDPRKLDPNLVEITETYMLDPKVNIDDLSSGIKEILLPLLVKSTSVSLKTKDIDNYTNENNKLPAGILAKPRVKTMTIKKIQDVKAEDNE